MNVGGLKMVIQCVGCEKVFKDLLSFNNSKGQCPNCHNTNFIVGYVNDKIVSIFVKVKREDNKIDTCEIQMPESFLSRDRYDDTYDDLLSDLIEQKIDFKGFGYEILKVKKK